MNQLEKKTYKLGPAIRNICDELINELNEGVRDMANNKGEKTEKIREFKDKIKTNFHPLLKQVIKSLKSFIKIEEGQATIFCLNDFYQIIDRITYNLIFLNIMTDVYIFPEFNINDTIDLIFEGCSNNLRQKLVDFQLLDSILSKNLYDNNDIRFLVNNDLNNMNYNQKEKENNINVLLDKNNRITKDIINRLSNKFEEFNNFIISTKEGFNENNFKLYLDNFICLKLYNNFDIKFTIAQFDAKSYYILPIEIQYNKQIININDKDEIFIDKNKLLTKNDLYFFINKFRIKKENINDLIILSLNKTDFLEKCLLFKQFTNELFNEKFEMMKKEIKEVISKYDFPIKLEEKKNVQMDIENKIGIKNEEDNNINEISIFYNFSITMKKKNEFYIKLIYNKDCPTNIKIIYSHFILKNNIQNVQKIGIFLIVENKEIILNLDLKIIKNEIINSFEIYKRILLNFIGKKIKYIYPIYFNTFFVKDNSKQISFIMKNNEQFIKYFSIFINDKGKLCFENLYSSQLFNDDFNEINSIITNYLKCDEEDEKINDYIIQFNDYIKYIIIEKIFNFCEDKIKLIELDNNTKKMILHIYHSYNTDKNITTYFEINCQIFKGNINIINFFKISEIKLICENNNDYNKKIIFICDCQNYQSMNDINTQFQKFFRKLYNELIKKYELYLVYAYDIQQLTEKKITGFKLNHPLIIKEKSSNDDKEEIQWFELSNENNNFEIFTQEYKDKFLNYFKSIKLSRENNIFKFYLKDLAFKRKKNYSNIPNFYFESYTTMLQSIILGYELNEDAISITILGKMKLGYSNKIQIIFEEILPKLIYYMNSIFKLVDYLLINEPAPIIRICPIFMVLQIKYESFQKNLNYKFNLDKEPYFIVDGNFSSLFYKAFLITFGEEMVLKHYDYNNRKYLQQKSKNFFINYQIFDLLINKYKFKISMIEYPFNHFIPENSNIYCIFKDFNVFNLMSLNNMLLTVQIRNDNNIYLEFRDKNNTDLESNKYPLFNQYLNNCKFEYNIKHEQNKGYNKVIILINDENVDIKFQKFNEIINIFIILSKTN